MCAARSPSHPVGRRVSTPDSTNMRSALTLCVVATRISRLPCTSHLQHAPCLRWRGFLPARSLCGWRSRKTRRAGSNVRCPLRCVVPLSLPLLHSSCFRACCAPHRSLLSSAPLGVGGAFRVSVCVCVSVCVRPRCPPAAAVSSSGASASRRGVALSLTLRSDAGGGRSLHARRRRATAQHSTARHRAGATRDISHATLTPLWPCCVQIPSPFPPPRIASRLRSDRCCLPACLPALRSLAALLSLPPTAWSAVPSASQTTVVCLTAC